MMAQGPSRQKGQPCQYDRDAASAQSQVFITYSAGQRNRGGMASATSGFDALEQIGAEVAVAAISEYDHHALAVQLRRELPRRRSART